MQLFSAAKALEVLAIDILEPLSKRSPSNPQMVILTYIYSKLTRAVLTAKFASIHPVLYSSKICSYHMESQTISSPIVAHSPSEKYLRIYAFLVLRRGLLWWITRKTRDWVNRSKQKVAAKLGHHASEYQRVGTSMYSRSRMPTTHCRIEREESPSLMWFNQNSPRQQPPSKTNWPCKLHPERKGPKTYDHTPPIRLCADDDCSLTMTFHSSMTL